MDAIREGIAAVYLIPVWLIAAISFRVYSGRWKFVSIFRYAALVKSEDRNLLFLVAGILWLIPVVVVIAVRLLTK